MHRCITIKTLTICLHGRLRRSVKFCRKLTSKDTLNHVLYGAEGEGVKYKRFTPCSVRLNKESSRCSN